MTHPSLDNYPIDDEYIGVTEQQASTHESDVDDPPYKYDASHEFDRTDTAMSGTEIDVKFDRKPVSDRDERGGTRTGFNAADADGFLGEQIYRNGKYQSRARWLMTLQNGYRDISLSRASQNSEMDRNHIVDTFSSRLDLTTHQHRRVKMVADEANMNEMAHYPIEVVVLAIISIVTNEDDRWIREEDMFKNMVRDVDGSMQGIKNSRNLVKRKSEYF